MKTRHLLTALLLGLAASAHAVTPLKDAQLQNALDANGQPITNAGNFTTTANSTATFNGTVRINGALSVGNNATTAVLKDRDADFLLDAIVARTSAPILEFNGETGSIRPSALWDYANEMLGPSYVDRDFAIPNDTTWSSTALTWANLRAAAGLPWLGGNNTFTGNNTFASNTTTTLNGTVDGSMIIPAFGGVELTNNRVTFPSLIPAGKVQVTVSNNDTINLVRNGGSVSGNLSLLGGNQTANRILAGPASGNATTPTFRVLVDADLPTSLANKNMTGTFTVGGVALGGAAFSANNSFLSATGNLSEINGLGPVAMNNAQRNIDAPQRDDISVAKVRTAYNKAWQIVNRGSLAGSRNMTATASTDTINITAHGYLAGEQVEFPTLTGGAGLSTNTTYFVRDVATNTFKVATTLNGTAVDITTDATAGTARWLSAPRLTIAVVGDSVANSKPQFLTPLFTRAFGMSALDNAVGYALGGDAWIANGSGGQPYDETISPTGEYFSIGNATGTVAWLRGGSGVFCNRVAIYYIREPGAGTFKVQRSTQFAPSVWTDEPGYTSINATAGNVTWSKIVLTPPQGFNSVRLVHLSGGRVRSINPIYTDTATPGVTVRRLDRGGIATTVWGNVDAGLLQDYLTEAGPDLAFYEAKEASSYIASALSTMASRFASACPQMNWIYMETAPLSTNPTDEADQDVQNALLRAHAENTGQYCFDGSTPVGGKAAMLALNWQGDGIHVSPVLSEYLSWILYRKLDWMFPRAPYGFVGMNGHLTNRLSFGNTDTDPTLSLTTGSGAFYDLSAGANGQSATSKSFLRFNNADGTTLWNFSFHSTQQANPSSIPNWLGFTQAAGGANVTFTVRALADEWRLTPTFSGSVSAFIGAINAPRLVQGFGTTVAAGTDYASANTANTYALTSSPTIGQRHFFSGVTGNWTVTIPNNARVCFGNLVVSGSSGTLAGEIPDSVTLYYMGTTFGGVQDWRAIAPTPGVRFNGNPLQGRVTLTAGVGTVSNNLTSNATIIDLQRQIDGGTVAASYSINRTAGASFTVTAKDGSGGNQTSDTSTLGWRIVEP